MTLSELFSGIDWSTVVTALIAGGLGYLGIKATARSQKDVALGPDWNNFVEQMRDWADRQVADADAEAEEERTRRKDLQGRYRSALRTLRGILSRHPDEREHVPNDIQCDL